MADISDVSQALLTIATNSVYPNGTASPSIAATPVKLYEGWPNAQQLDADLLAGICHVSIFSRAEEKNTTRYSEDWHPVSLNIATLTLTISGLTVTVGGVMPSPFTAHNLVIFVNNSPYVYAVQSGDTLNSIAAALSALISGSSVSGAVITMPATARINSARVGVTGTSIKNMRQQLRRFQISIWADTPNHRALIASGIDVVLADIRFLTLPDGTAGRLIYVSSPVTDSFENEQIFRRDLIYSVDYSTTATETETQVTQIQINKATEKSGATAFDQSTTNYY